jgi:HD-like signal output (HDOD) protein
MAACASEIRDFIRSINDGSTIPAMLGKILSVVSDETSSAQELSQLVSYDQALAEMVLRVANSAIFGHSGKIRDIDQAVMFLGYEKIKSIAVGMTVIKIFPVSSFDIKNLWIHGYEVAFIANTLSESLPTTSPRESFLAGLLHDIGRVIFYKKDPAKFLETAASDDLPVVERELFGCSHEDAGSWFLENTGLPEDIIVSVKYHHRPSEATSYKDAVSIISLAEAMSNRLVPRRENDGLWTPEHDAIMRRFSLTEDDIISIGSRLGGIRHEVEEFFS